MIKKYIKEMKRKIKDNILKTDGKVIKEMKKDILTYISMSQFSLSWIYKAIFDNVTDVNQNEMLEKVKICGIIYDLLGLTKKSLKEI